MSAPAKTQPETAAAPAISPTAGLILLAWLALGAALGLVPDLRGPLTFGFVLVGWVLAVMAHEFGHALVAWLGGDHTVAAKGYLTLDPRHYLDAGTSLVIPLVVLAVGGVGLPGGAVYLRPDLMRGPLWRAAASLAGPGMTLVVLLFLSGGLAVLRAAAPDAQALAPALAFLAFLQATAFCLNLLPIPGLDGYGALRPFLPGALTLRLRKLEGLLFIGFAVLLLTPSPLNRLVFGAAADLAGWAGVPGQLIFEGFNAFRFWV
ncbi:site-2 protease family protein [Phenylobacterium sp.]|jgi:Zn-dependent protease|uniref:site-2 protease family protein n=1 Tax=Phenylobacterium sp. TaxID=1871053 RepID=UPI002F41E1FD